MLEPRCRLGLRDCDDGKPHGWAFFLKKCRNNAASHTHTPHHHFPVLLNFLLFLRLVWIFVVTNVLMQLHALIQTHTIMQIHTNAIHHTHTLTNTIHHSYISPLAYRLSTASTQTYVSSATLLFDGVGGFC